MRRCILPVVAVLLSSALLQSAGLLYHRVAAAGDAVTYSYDADGRLTGVAAAGKGSATYHYDANGNITAIDRSRASLAAALLPRSRQGAHPPPIVSSLSGAVVADGDTVTVSGSGFDPVARDNVVHLNGTVAPVQSVSPNTLVVQVPPFTGSGPGVSVSTPGGTASGGGPVFIPPDPYTPSNVGATARVAVGGVTDVNLALGTIGLIQFDGRRGERVAVDYSNSTIRGSVSIYTQDSVRLGNPGPLDQLPGSYGPTTLPFTGTYTVLIEAPIGGQGSFSVVDSGGGAPAPSPATGDGGISGQVRDASGDPLAGVLLSTKTQRVRTDRNGYFFLEHLSPGYHAVLIDGTAATTHAADHGIFKIQMLVQAGQTTPLPYTIWLPRIDTQHDVTIASPTRHQVVLTTPRIPGLKVIIPKGAVIRDAQGKVVHRLGITPVSTERPPFPFPRGYPLPVYFTVQPGVSSVTPGRVRVIYPNVTHTPPGQKMPFWGYDPDTYGWWRYGYGTVTRDGRSVVPDKGVFFDEFTGAGDGFDDPPPLIGPCDCTDPPPTGDTPGFIDSPLTADGDPVDLSSGLFVHTQTDLTLQDVIPIGITRTYRQWDPTTRVFGTGQNFNYSLILVPDNSTYNGEFYRRLSLMLPTGALIPYTLTSSATSKENARYTATTNPSQFYASTIHWNGSGWTLRLTDGFQYIFSDTHTAGANAVLRMLQDADGNTVRFLWDNVNSEILGVKSPNGRWIQITYNSSSRQITAAHDDLGRTMRYEYSANIQLTAVTQADGSRTTYHWIPSLYAPVIQSITDARGLTFLVNQYQNQTAGKTAHSLVGWQTLADGGTYRFAYTANGSGHIVQTRVTDPRGHVRQVSFNADGYIIRDTYAAGTRQAETYTYERQPGSNLVLSVTDPLGRKTTYTYDARGNVTRATSLAGTPRAQTYSFTYDPGFSQMTSVTDPLGHKARYNYDPATGDLLTAADPLGHTWRFRYDGEGNVTGLVDPLGDREQFAYSFGDLVRSTDELGRTSTQFVDAAGRTLQQTDPLGYTSSVAYDDLDQVTRVTDPLGAVTRAAYDANGNLTALTDANGHRTTYAYDRFDRLIRMTDPLGKSERYTYDRNSNVISYRNRKGQVTRYRYDALDRLITVTFADGSSIRYRYDRADRLISARDSKAGTITDAYDGLDRLTRETSPQGTVIYSYDAADRETGMSGSRYAPVQYGYDAAGDLTSIRQGTSAVRLSWDADGRQTRVTLPGSVSERYTYDAASQLTGIGYAHLSSPLGNLTYGYNADGQVTAVGGSWARANLPRPVTATYNAADELTRWGTTRLTYDANGNLIGEGKTRYAWNARDQLGRVTSASKTIGSFVYDAFGRRIEAAFGKSATTYLYDGDNPIEELSGRRVAATMLDGLSLDEYYVRTSGGTRSDLLTDALGSTVALTSAAGAVTTQYTYDPFGNATMSGHSSGNRFQYTGRESDGSGLDFYRARYYSPATGRFISPDPLGFAGGDTNLYAYSFDDPVDLVDPTGTQPQSNNDPLQMLFNPRQTVNQINTGLQPNAPRTYQLMNNPNLTPEERQQLIDQNYATTEQVRRQMAAPQKSNIGTKFFNRCYTTPKNSPPPPVPPGARYAKPTPGKAGTQQPQTGPQPRMVWRKGKLVPASR